MHRLVVIDDEYIVVEGIKALISRLKLDYEMAGAAYDGIHGLETVQREKPDVVITDIRIPGMDGLSLIEAAKETCPDTVFVVISGYSEFIYAQRALALGVKGYIDKPITAEKLREVFKRIERDRERTQHEHTEKARENRKQYEQVEKIFEAGIRSITEGNSEEFRGYSRQVISSLKKLYPELSEFRREFYKHLCVLSDVLCESQKQVERSTLVSFQEMEKCDSFEKVQEYGEGVLSDIEKHLTADQTGSSHRVILELLNYLEEHYHEDIGLGELADKVGMSTAYLSVLFKAEVGTSYVKYLTELRMKKAKKLLQDGHKVHEVSELIGYNNYRYFCDIFKKHEGMTPNEYKGKVWKKE